MDLRRCLFLLFGSTLVIKIKKTQESTPSWESNDSKAKKESFEDKENLILLPVASPFIKVIIRNNITEKRTVMYFYGYIYFSNGITHPSTRTPPLLATHISI